jgi:hypothetical protein
MKHKTITVLLGLIPIPAFLLGTTLDGYNGPETSSYYDSLQRFVGILFVGATVIAILYALWFSYNKFKKREIESYFYVILMFNLLFLGAVTFLIYSFWAHPFQMGGSW